MSSFAPTVSDFRTFWDDYERRGMLSDVLSPSMKVLGLRDRDFDLGGACHGYSVTFFADALSTTLSKSTYYRIKNDVQSSREDTLTVVLYGIGMLAFSRRELIRDLHEPCLQGLGTLFQSFLDFSKKLEEVHKAIAVERNAPPVPAAVERNAPPVPAAVDLIRLLFSLRGDIGADAAARFFQGNERAVYFDTYRFSVRPGYVHKSFTVVMNQRENLPIITFRNFVKRENGKEPRRSDGVVLPFAQQTAFIGQSEGGYFSKVMVFPNRPPQVVHRGLLISEEPDDAISARVLLKASKVTHSMETQTGLVHVSESGLSEEDLNSMRNKVPFVLEGQVRNPQGQVLSQEQIVHQVGYLMQDLDGRPRLSVEGGELFNPASDSFYTFNSALKRRD